MRDATDALDDIEERRIPKLGRKLDKVDCTIQLAKLNSVDNDDDDHSTTSSITNNTTTTNSSNSTSATAATAKTNNTKKHYILSQTPKINKDLSGLSYNLDKLAAEVDAIQSHGDSSLRGRKKALSTHIVTMMDRVDGFISECGVILS